MARKPIPQKLRTDVWKKYFGLAGSGKCFGECDQLIDPFNFECGHIISFMNNGKTEIDNLVPICTSCNRKINGHNMIDFLGKYGYDTSRLKKHTDQINKNNVIEVVEVLPRDAFSYDYSLITKTINEFLQNSPFESAFPLINEYVENGFAKIIEENSESQCGRIKITGTEDIVFIGQCDCYFGDIRCPKFATTDDRLCFEHYELKKQMETNGDEIKYH